MGMVLLLVSGVNETGLMHAVSETVRCCSWPPEPFAGAVSTVESHVDSASQS